MNDQTQPLVPNQTKTPGIAITSLVFGILGLTCLVAIGSIPAIICGHIARNRINNSGGTLSGGGVALAGLITGYTGLALSVVFIMIIPLGTAITLPAVSSARNRAQEVASLNNVAQLTTACLAYAIDHDGQLPENLQVLVEENIVPPSVLVSPFSDPHEQPGYRIVAQGRLGDLDDPSATILIEETAVSHRVNKAVGYLDGRVESRPVP